MRQSRNIVLSGFLLSALIPWGFAQKPADPEAKTIRVGVPVPTTDRSRRLVEVKWARNRLVDDLKSLAKEKKSKIIIEAVALDSRDKNDIFHEASEKDCEFVLTTALADPQGGGGVVIGPDGLKTGPTLIGNTDPRERLGVTFALLRTSSRHVLAEGVVTAPAENDDDTSAATEAMRLVALRAADELRKYRPPAPD